MHIPGEMSMVHEAQQVQKIDVGAATVSVGIYDLCIICVSAYIYLSDCPTIYHLSI